VVVATLALAGAARALPAEPAVHPTGDPIGVEIERWETRIATTKPGDDDAKGIREGSKPLLDQAQKALAEGYRWFALSRLAFVWTNLEAADYRATVPSELRGQMSELESQWNRLAAEIEAARSGAGRPRFDAVPAAARAIGETALSESAGYYGASLDYGKNTAPEYGLFYLGAARAQLAMARLAAGIEAEETAPPLVLRSVAPEIARVEDELLAAYVPPASIDSHPVFIRIAALLKQARELDAAGLRHGALYRLLDAEMRLARLRFPDRRLEAAEAQRWAAVAESRLAATGVDPSLARLFVEIALVQVADPDPAMLGPQTAAAVFDEVVPLYLTVLGPAPPAPPDHVAEATVTLVRWPYT